MYAYYIALIVASVLFIIYGLVICAMIAGELLVPEVDAQDDGRDEHKDFIQ